MSGRVKRHVSGVCALALVSVLVAYAFVGYLTPAALLSLLSGLTFCG